jgi:protein gp37
MNHTAINRTEKTWNPKHRFVSAEPLLEQLGVIHLCGIDWLIAGAESGCPGRPFDVDWAEDLQRQCAKQGTAFLAKQLGAKAILDGKTLIILNCNGRHNGHAGDPNQWPKAIAGLRTREFPPSMLSASGSAKHGEMVLA